MTATRQSPPEGRYGRTADVRADRKLKIVGAVLGAALLALVGWLGYSYITGQSVSGAMIGFKVVSDEAVETHLEVRKDSDAVGVCTLRAQAESGAEVGRKDFRFEERRDRIDRVVTVRTTERATAVELVGCKPVAGG